MLPIAQIGNMLSQNQWTEELPHGDADDSLPTGDFANNNHPYLPPAGYSVTGSIFCVSKTLAYLHYSERIPSNHSAEVVIPPPDSVS